MFTLSVETHFWASHQPALPDGSKERLHHHNWHVTAEVSSNELDEVGIVMDFCRLRAMMDHIAACFDNSPLEKHGYFQQNNATAENVAKYVYEKLETGLPKGVRLDCVRVVESPGCSARFSRG